MLLASWGIAGTHNEEKSGLIHDAKRQCNSVKMRIYINARVAKRLDKDGDDAV